MSYGMDRGNNGEPEAGEKKIDKVFLKENKLIESLP